MSKKKPISKAKENDPSKNSPNFYRKPKDIFEIAPLVLALCAILSLVFVAISFNNNRKALKTSERSLALGTEHLNAMKRNTDLAITTKNELTRLVAASSNILSSANLQLDTGQKGNQLLTSSLSAFVGESKRQESLRALRRQESIAMSSKWLEHLKSQIDRLDSQLKTQPDLGLFLQPAFHFPENLDEKFFVAFSSNSQLLQKYMNLRTLLAETSRVFELNTKTVLTGAKREPSEAYVTKMRTMLASTRKEILKMEILLKSSSIQKGL